MREGGVRIEKSPLFGLKFPRSSVPIKQVTAAAAAAEEDGEEDERRRRRRFGVRGTMTARKNRTDSNRKRRAGERARERGREGRRPPCFLDGE